MTNSIRDLIRGEMLRDYQPPSAGLVTRAMARVDRIELRGSKQRHNSLGRPRRPLIQEVALSLALIVVGTATLIGPRVLQGLQDSVVSLPGGVTVGGLHPATADLSIVDSRFVSGDVGWILAQKGVHDGPTVLFATRDGGQHWSEQLRFASGTGSPAMMTFWPDGRNGLFAWRPSAAAGAPTMRLVVYRTEDGGAHWVAAAQPFDLGPAFYLNPSDAWQISVGTPTPQTGRAVTSQVLLHTVDGGQSWTPVGQVPTIGQLWFRDALTGWLTISNSTSWTSDATGKMVPISNSSEYLYMTGDGGKTWRPQPLQLPVGAVDASSDVRVSPPVFVDSVHALLPVEVIPPPTNLNGPQPSLSDGSARSVPVNYVFVSADGGANWSNPTRLPAGLDQGGEMFLTSTHWLVAHDGTLMETANAGASWSSRHVLVDGFSFDLAPWALIDQRAIWSQTSSGSLIRSLDGGEDWKAIKPPEIR